MLLLLLEVLLTAMWRRKKGMMKRKGNEKFIRLSCMYVVSLSLLSLSLLSGTLLALSSNLFFCRCRETASAGRGGGADEEEALTRRRPQCCKAKEGRSPRQQVG